MPTLTLEELNKRFGEGASSEKTPEPTVLENIGSKLKERASNIGGIFKNYFNDNKGPLGQTSYETGAQAAGQVVAGVGDIFGEVLAPVIKPALEPVLNTDLGKAAIHSLGAGLEVYENWKKASPANDRVGKNIEAVINISSLFPAVKAGQVGINGAVNAAKGTAKAVETGFNTAKITSKEAIKTAKKDVLAPIAEKLNPIDNATVHELKNSSADEFKKYVTVARKGAENKHNPSAFDAVGETAGEATKIMKKKLDEYGRNIGATTVFEGAKDVSSPVLKATNRFYQLVKDRTGAVFNKKGELTPIFGRGDTLTPDEKSFLKEMNAGLAKINKNSTFQEVNDFVDTMQKKLNAKKQQMLIPKKSNVEAILGSVTGEINSGLKGAGSKRYVLSNAKYSEISDAFKKLNKLLGEDGKNGGAVIKRVFSPHDAGTKKLFAKVYEITGIDLVKEATLAKHAMEKVGDPRSLSLLEGVNLLKQSNGTLGTIEKISKYLIDKSHDPIEQALKMTKPK